jgi:ubiquinone/menaquinone biosynthesis C-methylase UbiE
MSNEWQNPQHARDYLERADTIPHRGEGEAALLAEVPPAVRRILDLGSGDGRLLALVLARCPSASGVALDVSPPMLEQLRRRFAADTRVRVIEHDLERTLPELGSFDVVCSSFAIHHLPHDRKRGLYEKVWRVLQPGGVFCNLEHVASPTPELHRRFLEEMGITPAQEDPSNKLLDAWTQLEWLRDIGFEDVDCLWKWRELALLYGRKPPPAR